MAHCCEYSGRGRSKKLSTFYWYYNRYKKDAYGLGSLTKEQFYTYSPIELFDYLNSKAEYIKKMDEFECIRTGVICATIANSSGRYKRKLTYKDFFDIKEPKKEHKDQSTQDQINMIKAFEQTRRN